MYASCSRLLKYYERRLTPIYRDKGVRRSIRKLSPLSIVTTRCFVNNRRARGFSGLALKRVFQPFQEGSKIGIGNILERNGSGSLLLRALRAEGLPIVGLLFGFGLPGDRTALPGKPERYTSEAKLRITPGDVLEDGGLPQLQKLNPSRMLRLHYEQSFIYIGDAGMCGKARPYEGRPRREKIGDALAAVKLLLVEERGEKSRDVLNPRIAHRVPRIPRLIRSYIP